MWKREDKTLQTFQLLGLAGGEVVHITSPRSPADAILEQVRALKPRVLVMGAHGHHPVRDRFVTSVTSHVLQDCPVPVFVGA